MKIVKNKINIEITPAERKTFEEMVAFTSKFFEQNNQCATYHCTKCPLNLFCHREDLSRATQEIVETIEEFLNE